MAERVKRRRAADRFENGNESRPLRYLPPTVLWVANPLLLVLGWENSFLWYLRIPLRVREQGRWDYLKFARGRGKEEQAMALGARLPPQT